MSGYPIPSRERNLDWYDCRNPEKFQPNTPSHRSKSFVDTEKRILLQHTSYTTRKTFCNRYNHKKATSEEQNARPMFLPPINSREKAKKRKSIAKLPGKTEASKKTKKKPNPYSKKIRPLGQPSHCTLSPEKPYPRIKACSIPPRPNEEVLPGSMLRGKQLSPRPISPLDQIIELMRHPKEEVTHRLPALGQPSEKHGTSAPKTTPTASRSVSESSTSANDNVTVPEPRSAGARWQGIQPEVDEDSYYRSGSDFSGRDILPPIRHRGTVPTLDFDITWCPSDKRFCKKNKYHSFYN